MLQGNTDELRLVGAAHAWNMGWWLLGVGAAWAKPFLAWCLNGRKCQDGDWNYHSRSPVLAFFPATSLIFFLKLVLLPDSLGLSLGGISSWSSVFPHTTPLPHPRCYPNSYFEPRPLVTSMVVLLCCQGPGQDLLINSVEVNLWVNPILVCCSFRVHPLPIAH